MQRLLVILLPLLLATFAGCNAPPDVDVKPETAVAWTPIYCAPNQADWIAHNARTLPYWLQDPELIGKGIADALGQVMMGHRGTNKGDQQIHEWAIEHSDGTYLGQMEISERVIPVGVLYEEWHVQSHAGLPGGVTAETAEQYGTAILANMDPEGVVTFHMYSEDRSGLVEMRMEQLFQGRPVMNVLDTSGFIEGYRSPKGAAYLTARPVYDLSAVEPQVEPGEAIMSALAYWECVRPQDPAISKGLAYAVVQESLVYIVGLDRAGDNPFSCIPPVMVDVYSGAVLGQMSADVCSVKELESNNE